MKKFTQKKQLTAVIMAASLAFASLTGCSSSSAGKEPAGQETEAAVNVSLDDVLNKIKEAYGEGYIPNTPMDDQMLKRRHRPFSGAVRILCSRDAHDQHLRGDLHRSEGKGGKG